MNRLNFKKYRHNKMILNNKFNIVNYSGISGFVSFLEI
ncbi:hypothetical protein X965_16950 [Morganella sp. EGD-HP17]|nr:hypothetical protein X965_16950 [Morganella sp. EGD-HP17]KJY05059.1 hypothetical protein Mm0Y_01532 [Morganella morganii]